MYKFARICLGVLSTFLLSSAVFSATFTVTKTADTNDGACDADCSLREAIGAANSAAGDDVINFGAIFGSNQTITLSLGEMVIANNGSLTINGNGANLLTIDANNSSRILATSASVVATINGITFTRGTGAGATDNGRGGAIYNAGGTLTLNNSIITGNNAANGGGLNNASSGSPAVPANLTLNNCIVSNNTSAGSGGGMQNFSTSTLTINNSTFIGNTSLGSTGGGGGQFNGAVRITNSTFVNNAATGGSGGGFQTNGTLGTIITNVTITGNSSTNNGGGIHRGTTNANFFIRNTIVAGNNGIGTSPDITNSTGGTTSLGNNIIGNVGTSTGWIASDQQNVNPLLSPYGFYGGSVNTFLPLSASTAINGGQNCVVDLSCTSNNPPIAVTTDQRGAARPFGASVDIGAVEASSDYVAILPNAAANQSYNFVIAPSIPGFTYLLNSGSFGGITLTSNASMAFLSGAPNQTGTFDSVVQITNNVNSTTQKYRITVTGNAASAIIGGRVLTSTGQPLSNITVSISNGSGVLQTTTTSGFGYFTFTALPAGQVYTISAASKRFAFTPQNVTPSGDVTDIVITPND